MQDLNVIGIDPSINCTAVTANEDIYVFSADHITLTKKMNLKAWFKNIDDLVNIHAIQTTLNSSSKYSLLELEKLISFKMIVENILKSIDKSLNSGYNTLCLIEGYSYSSSAGPIIDLVAFGTTLRSIINAVPNTELIIVAPLTLKRETAKLTYPEIKKGKKITYRNNNGTAGGSFNKHDMMGALIENPNLNSDWIKFLRNNASGITKAKNIPKPIDDVNDSVLLYEIAKSYSKDYSDFLQLAEALRNL